MIDGNIQATVQIKTSSGKNVIGENIESWENAGEVKGYIDFASGQNDMQNYNAKLQRTSHYFICDYQKWIAMKRDQNVTAENSRMIINENIYNVLMIDNPMELNQHIEVYLEYVGGGM